VKLNITTEPYELGDYINLSYDDALPCEDAECTEIIAEEIIDYIPIDKTLDIIQLFVSKLRLGGKIVLGGTDIIELSKDILRQNKTMVEVNHELFGDGKKQGCLALNDVATILSHLGLKVTKQRLDGAKFIVEAIRENG